MSSTKLSAFCSKVLEIGWLLAMVITPLFFNIWSDRVFEPDKLTTLRTVAVIMASVWLVKMIEELIYRFDEIEWDFRQIVRKLAAGAWRTPLIAPTLFMVVAYLISTLFSVTPRVSFFGSYQRLQGTYTTFSYIVVFLIILQELRTREQLDRLISVVILNSLPIALYGFLQRNGLDPLPWGGDVARRIASNMGNPIFVGAYLIMVSLPTLARIIESFRAILNDEDTGMADVLRAATYIFVFLVQVIAVWYTLSRGPQMGLLAGLGIWGFLGLLVLQRAAQREQPFRRRDLWKDLGLGLLFGVGSVAVAGGLAAAGYAIAQRAAGPESSVPQWVAAGVAVVVVLGVWMFFLANRLGWRWLWVSALLLVILISAGFLSINLIEPVHEWSEQQPWLGRLDDVLQAESGTGKVRALLWEQALDLVMPHEPIEFPPTQSHPTWRPDRWNAIRPLVGYGPESMFVAANRFYPLELAHYEKRTSSGDRAHNETMDTLVITGVFGFSAYLWLFGSIFYFGLRWLGFLPKGWRRTVFFLLIVIGPVAAVAAVVPALGAHFLGLAIPIGIVGGMFLYLVVYGFSLYSESEPVSEEHPHTILLVGILSAIVAHLVEINFGIAIASTRTTFWAFAGILAVLGMNLIEAVGKEEASETVRNKKRRRRSRSSSSLPAWMGNTLATAVVCGFILGTLAFDLIGTNNARNDDPVTIFWQALTTLPEENGRASYGVLMIFGLTWLMSAIIFFGQMIKSGMFERAKRNLGKAIGIYLGVSLAVGMGYALLLGFNLSSLVDQQPTWQELISHLTGTLSSYYMLIVFVLVAGGSILYLATQRLPQEDGHPVGLGAVVVLAIVAGLVVVNTNLYPIQADVIFKSGSPERRAGQWNMAIAYDQVAHELDPNQDQYYLYHAMDLQQYIWSLSDTTSIESVLYEFERVALKAQDLNPLATDHSANLARVYQTWYQLVPSEGRAVMAEEAITYHETATRLSPHNTLLWNQWANFLMILGDEEGAQKKLDQSLSLDAEFVETWLIQADLYARQGIITGTIESYQQALALNEKQPNVLIALGDAYTSQGLITDAVEAYAQALEYRADSTDALMGLAQAYEMQGALENAADVYNQVIMNDPSNAVAWYSLGAAYGQMGRLQEAADALLRSVELAPAGSTVWSAYRLLGLIYEQVGEYDQALLYAQLALETAPESQLAEIESIVARLEALLEGE